VSPARGSRPLKVAAPRVAAPKSAPKSAPKIAPNADAAKAAVGPQAATTQSLRLPAGILVGWIRRPHGIRGEVRVDVQSDNPERFVPGAELILRMPSGECRLMKIATSRSERDCMLIGFEGIADRNAVESWRNARLEIEEGALPALPAGEIYIFELVGCECFDRQAGHLGRVAEVIEDGGGLMLLVEKEGRILPIPYAKTLVPEVDVATRRIGVDLPDGLIEACLQTPA